MEKCYNDKRPSTSNVFFFLAFPTTACDYRVTFCESVLSVLVKDRQCSKGSSFKCCNYSSKIRPINPHTNIETNLHFGICGVRTDPKSLLVWYESYHVKHQIITVWATFNVLRGPCGPHTFVWGLKYFPVA